MFGLVGPVVVEVLLQSQLVQQRSVAVMPYDRVKVAVVVLVRVLPRPPDGDVERVDLVVPGAVLEGEREAVPRLTEITCPDKVDRYLLVVVRSPVVRTVEQHHVAHEVELLPESRRAVEPGERGIGNHGRIRRKVAGRPRDVLVLLLEDVGEGADSVPEPVDERTGVLLEIARLGEGPGEVEVRDVDGFPLVGELGEPVTDRELGPALRRVDGGIHPESRTGDHSVVDELGGGVPAQVVDRDEVASIGAPLDPLDRAVQYRVLGLQLVGVEEPSVHRAQVTNEMRSPGKPDGARPGDVNDRGLFGQVICRLEGRVPLADK
jgi:hypothetical protein